MIELNSQYFTRAHHPIIPDKEMQEYHESLSLIIDLIYSDVPFYFFLDEYGYYANPIPNPIPNMLATLRKPNSAVLTVQQSIQDFSSVPIFQHAESQTLTKNISSELLHEHLTRLTQRNQLEKILPKTPTSNLGLFCLRQSTRHQPRTDLLTNSLNLSQPKLFQQLIRHIQDWPSYPIRIAPEHRTRPLYYIRPSLYNETEKKSILIETIADLIKGLHQGYPMHIKVNEGLVKVPLQSKSWHKEAYQKLEEMLLLQSIETPLISRGDRRL